ncbi:hypothetical protein BDZ45DRAFT_649240 [Acephala macrosclerotiorum]|nr:hypothetical protein BDZ45DRAFT_649240 [Acephala macrosclerotiorum]
MAILDKVPGLEVTFCVDGMPLEEYDDDEELTLGKPGAIGEYQVARTVSKYVEALSDKEFSINVKMDSSFSFDCPSIATPINVDGKLATAPVLIKANYATSLHGNRIVTPIVRKVDGVYVAAPGNDKQQFLKKFKFSPIDTTTDDSKLKDVKKDSEVVGKVGEIQVKVYRAAQPIELKSNALAEDVATSLGAKVHEKALKGEAKSHSVKFGPASQLVEKSYWTTENLDGDDYPIAIFKFKYRSRDALKSLLIIERTPSPDPESVSGSTPPMDLNNLDPAQKRQLARLLKDMNRDRSSSSIPQRTIKRERDVGEGPSNSKKMKSWKKFTIDLTEDSD